VPDPSHLDGAEVDGEDVERGLGATLERGDQIAGVTVRPDGGVIDDGSQDREGA